jgi:hypothetical protein
MATGYDGPINEEKVDKIRTAERLLKELKFDEYDLGEINDTDTPYEVVAVLRYIDMVKQSVEMNKQEKLKILEKIRMANEVPYKAVPKMVEDLLTKEPHLNYPHNLKVLFNLLNHREEKI